jgi:plasmid maintenance system antidote protein VapI
MNTIIRKITITLSATIALLLASCLDVEQEFWIHADGSGRIKVTNKVPSEIIEGIRGLQEELAQALGAELGEDPEDPFGLEVQKKELEAHKNVKSVKVSSTVEGEFTSFTYDIQARDMTKAHEILAVLYESMGEEAPEEGGPVDLEKLFTGVRITKLRGSDYRFTADLGSREEGQDDDPANELGRELMKGMFGDAGITIRVHGVSVKSAGKAPAEVEEWAVKYTDLGSNKVPTVEAEVTAFRHAPKSGSTSTTTPTLELEDTQGRSIKASIIQIAETSVRIRKAGSVREFVIERSKLSSKSNDEIDALGSRSSERR